MSYFYHIVLLSWNYSIMRKSPSQLFSYPEVVCIKQDKYLILSPEFSPSKAHNQFSMAFTVTITQHFCSREVPSMRPAQHPSHGESSFLKLLQCLECTSQNVMSDYPVKKSKDCTQPDVTFYDALLGLNY